MKISNIASHTTGKNGNFEHSKMDYIVSKIKWDFRGHVSFTAWIPHVFHVACHISIVVSIFLLYFFHLPPLLEIVLNSNQLKVYIEEIKHAR
jgi:hypothetical protein